MHDPMAVVKAGQWIQVRYGAYKGDVGFVTGVETWGVQVLVVPRLKIPTSQQAAASLKKESKWLSSQNQGYSTLILSHPSSNVRQNLVAVESTPCFQPWTAPAKVGFSFDLS